MSLRPLGPGLTPDEVEKLRWETFGHKRATSIRSAEDLVRFTTLRGFVFLHPQPGLHYPSALEAAVGRPLLDHVYDERGGEVETWRAASIAARKLVGTAVLGGHDCLLSPAFLADFYALSGNRGDLLDHERWREGQALGAEAAAVCACLGAAGRALARTELEQSLRLRSALGRERLRHALAECSQRLLVVEVGTPAQPPQARSPAKGRARAGVRPGTRGTESPQAAPPASLHSASPHSASPHSASPHPASPHTASPHYDLLPRVYAEQVKRGVETAPRTARQRIACRYLRNVIMGGCHEMAVVLGWSEKDALSALEELQEKGMAARHPASRHNRHFFQATSTDLLP